jgi:hypothetical protein
MFISISLRNVVYTFSSSSLIMLSIFVVVFLCIFLVDCSTICDNFRITSPVVSDLFWTAGQCYQVSYDLAGLGDAIHDKITVDVYNAVTNEKVSNVVNKEAFNPVLGGTRPFNMNVPETGQFYYMITLIHNGVECEPKKTVEFQVAVNPNSPPSHC